MKVTVLPSSTSLPELIALPPAVALSVPPVPSTLKVMACLGFGFAACGQPVNSNASVKNAAVMSAAAPVLCRFVI